MKFALNLTFVQRDISAPIAPKNFEKIKLLFKTRIPHRKNKCTNCMKIFVNSKT